MIIKQDPAHESQITTLMKDLCSFLLTIGNSKYIHSMIETHPELITHHLINSLCQMFLNQRDRVVKSALDLYKKLINEKPILINQKAMDTIIKLIITGPKFDIRMSLREIYEIIAIKAPNFISRTLESLNKYSSDSNRNVRSTILSIYNVILENAPQQITEVELNKLMDAISDQDPDVKGYALETFGTCLKNAPQFINQKRVNKILELLLDQDRFVRFETLEIYECLIKLTPKYIAPTIPIIIKLFSEQTRYSRIMEIQFYDLILRNREQLINSVDPNRIKKKFGSEQMLQIKHKLAMVLNLFDEWFQESDSMNQKGFSIEGVHDYLDHNLRKSNPKDVHIIEEVMEILERLKYIELYEIDEDNLDQYHKEYIDYEFVNSEHFSLVKPYKEWDLNLVLSEWEYHFKKCDVCCVECGRPIPVNFMTLHERGQLCDSCLTTSVRCLLCGYGYSERVVGQVIGADEVCNSCIEKEERKRREGN